MDWGWAALSVDSVSKVVDDWVFDVPMVKGGVVEDWVEKEKLVERRSFHSWKPPPNILVLVKRRKRIQREQ